METSQHFNEEPKLSKAEVIIKMIDEALEQNDKVMIPGQIGGVAVLGYRAQEYGS